MTSWPIDSMMRPLAIAAVLLVGAMPLGCARPQGLLFEPIEQSRAWPPPPSIPRIKYVGALADSSDLKPARTAREGLLSVLRGPRPPIKFTGPHTTALGGTDLVAVADAAGGTVHIINLLDRTHTVVAGSDEQRFGTPIGATWAGERLFITDAKHGEVVELDVHGKTLNRFGRDELKRPVGIAYAAQRDQLYVVDGDAGCIKVFGTGGLIIATIGHPGVETGAFNYPTHLCIRGDRLVVADSGNFRVQLLDLDGNTVRSIGMKGDGAGDFSLPKGVAVDSEGHIYVVDAHFENVQVFDEFGQLLMEFGQEGSGPGEFVLPAGVSIDVNDRIWVADSGNRRVQVFDYMKVPS